MSTETPSPDAPDRSPEDSGDGPLNYATGYHPAADSAGAPIAFRQGARLIAFNGTTLPAHCILCGSQGAGAAIRLTLTWDESFKVTKVSTLELRRKAIVFAFLCERHRWRWAAARRRGGIAIFGSLSLMAAGAAAAILSDSSDVPWYTQYGISAMIAGFAGIIVALFYFTFRTRTLTCSQIQEDYLYLEGASEDFLARLPELPTGTNHQAPKGAKTHAE
jgi:hypothetical protein